MYVPEKLKLNKFRQVNLPTLKQYFSRYGFLNVPNSSYSGDNVLPSGRKTDVLSAIDRMDRYQQYQESISALRAEDAPPVASQEGGAF